MPSRPAAALGMAAADPEVADAVAAARGALAELRWHPALRRRAAEVGAEVAVRAAVSVATLGGARVPLDVVRRVAGDTATGPPDRDPGVALAVRALRGTLALQRWAQAPPTATLQVLATLHTAAGAGLLEPAELGRPRSGSAPGLAALAAVVAGGDVPAGLRAAVAHAEILTLHAFDPVSAEVAFAFARGVVRWGGLDLLGVGLPEAHAAGDPAGYRGALARYAEDPVAWCRWWLGALALGAAHGRQAADAVMAGRFD